MLWCSTKINMPSKHQTKSWLSVQVSSISEPGPLVPSCTSLCCAHPWLPFRSCLAGPLCSPGAGVGMACPRILARYKRDVEKARAPHSSTLAWKIPWKEQPGRLQAVGLLRVGHDWATSLSLFTFMCWRRKWQPTPVFLPGESQGWRRLVGCRLWGRTESDMTEAT